MEKRKLGKSGIEFAPIAFGGNVFGWTADEATSHRLLDAFVDAGFSFIDTADVYSRWYPGNKGGESEAIIGTWLAARKARDKVVIATKVGWEMSADKKGLKKAYIVRAVAQKDLSRPDDGYADASDASGTLLGRFNRLYGTPGRTNPPQQAYRGNFGFILD